MKLGLLTVCLGEIALEEKAKWAAENGFEALEVACWPKINERDYSASDIDVDNLDDKQAMRINEHMKENNLIISSLAYYDNNLDCDLEKRTMVNKHLEKCIDTAVKLNVPTVGTFIGRDINKTVQENFDEYERVFTNIIKYAEDNRVKLIIENCPMEGWQKPGQIGNIAHSPETWEAMFERIPSDYFGLNFDPSHLHLQLIDYISLIAKFKDKIFHVHAKDVEIYDEKLKWYGAFNRQLDVKHGNGYWKYRMPSLGQVKWNALIKELKDIGYDNVISIEHEDYMYEGSIDKVKEGLMIAKRYLNKNM